MARKHHITLFLVEIEYEYEHRIRDWQGWVEGHGPRCGDYRKATDKQKIKTTQESYARAWVEDIYREPFYRNVTIKSITKETIEFDAIVEVD